MSNNTAKLHEPLFHIVKRSAIPKWQSWLVRIGSVIAALIVCGVVTVLLTGEDPIQVYVKMVEGAVGSERRLWMLAQNTAMLLCVALAVTPAFKMKFWNIGAEGQVLAGGLATAACMIFLGDKLSPVVLMIVMVAVSIVAGAVWGLIPAFFKALWNTNETLFTLMMNYIAMCIVSYFSYEWSVPKGSGHIGVINDTTEAGWLPAIGADTWKHFILPCITCCSVHLAQLIRMTRSNMLEVIRTDYVRTARAKGASERRVIFGHALRNALLPVITIVGLNLGAMLGGAVITESVFSISGVGTMIVNGIRKKDTPSVMAAILLVAVMISLVNLIVDIIYAYVDPRLRSKLK